jgi:hypothetical protein
VFLHDCANAIWSLKGPKGAAPFYFGYFFSTKILNHITKDAKIFHIKSNDSRKPRYFLTSIPSKHTSHHHSQPIASDWFLTWRNMLDLLHAINFDMERF